MSIEPSSEPPSPHSAVFHLRLPVQARSRERVQRILRVTEGLLGEMKPAAITPGLIAQRAAVSRASLYQFFPTKFAVFNEIAREYIVEFCRMIEERFDPGPQRSWRRAVSCWVDAATEFFHGHPPARALFYGDAGTTEIVTADWEGDRKLAQTLRRLIVEKCRIARTPDPELGIDVFLVAVEIADAIFAITLHEHRQVSDAVRAEIKDAQTSYLARHLDKRKSSSTRASHSASRSR